MNGRIENLDEFIAHQKSLSASPTSQGQRYSCPKCDNYSAPTQAILSLHMASMHPLYRNTFLESTPDGFPCPECGKLFETVNKKNRHFKNVHGEKNLICPHCPYRTGRKDNFVVHMRKQHPGKDMNPSQGDLSPPLLEGSTPLRAESPPLSPAPAVAPIGILPQAMLIQQLKILQTLKLLKDQQEALQIPQTTEEDPDTEDRVRNPRGPELCLESGDESTGTSLSEVNPDSSTILSAALGPMGPKEVEKALTRKRKMTTPRKAPKVKADSEGSEGGSLRESETLEDREEMGEEIGSLRCNECDFLALSASEIEQHRCDGHTKRIKSSKEPPTTARVYQCKFCDYSSVHGNNVKDHEKAVHDKIRDFSCKFCDYKASHKMTVVHHIKGVHLKIKEYSCQHCDFQASYRSTIRNHVQSIHLTAKDFSCKICPYKATSKRYIIDHIKGVHLRSRDKTCPLCSYKCTHSGDLRKHLTKVHDEDESKEHSSKEDPEDDLNPDDLIENGSKDESSESFINAAFKKNDIENLDIESMVTEIPAGHNPDPGRDNAKEECDAKDYRENNNSNS